jgi:hypothetical protein
MCVHAFMLLLSRRNGSKVASPSNRANQEQTLLIRRLVIARVPTGKQRFFQKETIVFLARNGISSKSRSHF